MKENVNYLEKIPVKNQNIGWSKNKSGLVTLEIENKGIVNKIFQRLLKKPKVSYIHLDETGSRVWSYIDGERTVFQIGKKMTDEDEQELLYERLSKYIEILSGYKFINFK